jgi:O-antigen/teichoic acid export membrane protein
LALANKTIGNALSGVVGFAWPILLALVSMPYIVHKLGNDAYGVLALVTSVLGFFAFLDLGVTNASVKYMAEAYAHGDVEKINKIVGSSLVVYLIAGGTGACVIALMTNTLVQRILKIPAGYIADSTFAFYVASCGFLLNMVLGVFAAVPKAVQRYDVATKVNISVSTSLTLLTVLTLYLGYGLREVVILNFFSSLASLAVYMLVAKNLVREISIRVCFDLVTFKKLFSFGAYSLLVTISATILFQLDRILIGTFAGAAQVAFYAVPASIAFRIHGFVASIMGVVFPLCSELHATGQKEKLRELYIKASRYSFIIGISIAMPLVVLSSEVMKYWMGEEYGHKSGLVLMLLASSSFFASLSTIPALLLDGIGKPRVNAFFAVLSALLNIMLCLLLIPRYGITGAALANLANFVMVVLYLVTVDVRILHIGLFRFVVEIWSRPLVTALVHGLITTFIIAPFITGLETLIAGLVASVGVFYLCAVAFKAVNNEDLTIFRGFVQSRIK